MIRRWALPLFLLAFALFYLLPLGFHGLWIPDETRYGQMGQEMLLTGHWATPHFMGLRYFEKPAGGYWMIAIAQAIFGQNLFGVRFASAFSLGASVLLTYLIANRLWQQSRISRLCATLYMSFGLVAAQAGYANLDPQFTLWVNLSLLALWYALSGNTRRQCLWGWAAVGVACGMGFMTKGFLAWVFPVLVAGPYMLWQRRFGELLRRGLLAAAVAVLVAAPWALVIHAQEADFWSFFFWHEHIRRFAAEDAQHAEPLWFYLPLLVISALPWALLLPQAARQAWHARRVPQVGFTLLWLLLPLAFLSLSRGKLPTYILPCMMPLALLLGHSLHTTLVAGKQTLLRSNAALNLLLGIVGAGALVWVQLKKPVYHDEPLHLALTAIAVLGWLACNLLALWRPLRLWAAPAVGMGVLVLLLPNALPDQVVDNKTPDRFIADHTVELSQATFLLSNDLGAASALAWHTARPGVFLFATGGEAKYGLNYPDAQGRLVEFGNAQPWMTEARQRGSVGVVMRLKDHSDQDLLALLPTDGKRYTQGNIMILLYDQTPP